MPYAIVSIQKPPRTPWPDGLDYYARELPIDEGLKQIAEGSWLICLDTDLLVLANLVQLSHKAQFPYHAVFFAEKPDLLSFAPSAR